MTPPNPRDAQPGRGTPLTRSQRRRIRQWERQQPRQGAAPVWEQPSPGQSQTAGWWMASDGRWYPPHLHPGPRAPSYSQLGPVGWQPPRRRGRGCLYSVLAVLALVLLIVVIAVIVAVSRVKTTPGSGTSRHPAAADVSLSSCSVDPTLKFP